MVLITLMDHKLVKIGSDKVGEVHEILKICGLDMKSKFGLSHWVPPYPLDMLRRDAIEKDVYAVCDCEQMLAVFTIGTKPSSYYDMSIWKNPVESAIYVNRLGVLPEFQGKGLGTRCMERIEKIAEEMNCFSVRLDIIEKHVKLQDFYGRLGYQRRGIVKFRDDLLLCLEKVFEK